MHAEVIIGAKIDSGFTVSDANGALQLAAIDSTGRVVASGESFAAALFNSAIKAHENFWHGRGHLTHVERMPT